MSTIFRDLETLTAFHFVAAELSVSKAAQRLGRSKSFVSGQIKRIESDLKIQLFYMSTRSVGLTDEGRILFEYSSQVFRRAQDTEQRLSELSEGLAGKLKLSLPVSLGTAFGNEIFAVLVKALPEVRIDLDLSNEERDFSSDQTDFAIRARPVHLPNLVAVSLGRIREVVCVADSLFAGLREIRDPAALSKLSCILNAQESFKHEWNFALAGRETTIGVKGKHSTNLYDSAKQLCLAGYGVAKLPAYLVESELKSGRLKRLFTNYEIATHPLFLVHAKKHTKTKKHSLAGAAILKWFETNKKFFLSNGTL